jgi:hypothetical protein
MVNRGEVVVKCLANVDDGRTRLPRRNSGQSFRLYFSGIAFLQHCG